MICGENSGIKGLQDLQKGLNDLMTQGKDALAQLEGELAKAQAELDGALGKLQAELEAEVKNFQAELMSLASSDSPTGFAQKLAEIKKEFGEAVEDLEEKLEELGITSFPPSLADVQKAICEKMPNIEVDVSGVAKELPKEPIMPSTIPIPNISKAISEAKETMRAIKALDQTINKVMKAHWQVYAATFSPDIARAKISTTQFVFHYYFKETLGYATFDEYISSRPGIKITKPKEKWQVILEQIEAGDGEDTWRIFTDEYNKNNDTSLSLDEAIKARHKAKTPEKKEKAKVPANAKPFTGEYNQETETLRNINGKTYVVPKENTEVEVVVT